MKLILSAGSLFTLPLHTIFEIGRDTGFDGMEIIINYDFRYGKNLKLVRELQEILPIASIHAPFLDIDGWGDKRSQLLRCVDIAAESGIPLVNFHPPAWLTMELGFLRWMKSVNDFQEEVGQGVVAITLENMPTIGRWKVNPYFWAKTTHMIDFMAQRNLYLTFDTAHMGSTKANFLQDFHLYYESGRMKNIHFSDYGNGREHLLPGHGVLPLTRFLNHLRETGYDHAVTLELSPYEFSSEVERIRLEMAEVFAFLEQETRRPPVRQEVRVDSLPEGVPDLVPLAE